MGFPGYFLIVADFIKWAKERSIPVGPGRGSGAGSLVAYALTITDLDPLRYGLLFERFLNPERISMPDFDIDFCMDRREEVIAYVAATLRPRPRRPDHHLRRAPLQGRGPRRRPRAADALRPGRPALEADPGRRRQARLDREGARRRAAAPRGGPPRAAGGAAPRDRRRDRGPAAQRLDPRRRRRHRRPPARRAGAALPRPALRHAGDPVQHEVGRGGGPGEVRLPRPEDPDRDPERPRPPEGPRASRSTSARSPSTTRRPTRSTPAPRPSRCSRWN